MRTPALARRLAGRVIRWRGLVCLNYHRIGDGTRSIFDRGLYSATEEGFNRQVGYLKENFDVISPRDIQYIVQAKRGRHVLITFDDGFADNYTAAFPILRRHKTVASFFIATGYIDNPRLPWWDEIAWMVRTSKRARFELPDYFPEPVVVDEPDREGAVRTLLRKFKKLASDRTADYVRVISEATGTGRPDGAVLDVQKLWMTWDMLREMHMGGMTIGGHTVNHPILSRMPLEVQRSEIMGCEKRIVEEIGAPMRAFAYPVGSRDAFNEDTRACLRERGVATAFTYYGGLSKLSAWDNHDIRRIAVEQDTTFSEFKALVRFPWAS